MGLKFSGKHSNSETFELLLEAFDGDKRVVVVSSTEAIEDYGLPAVEEKAAEKYAAGKLDHAGRVRVLTTDFA